MIKLIPKSLFVYSLRRTFKSHANILLNIILISFSIISFLTIYSSYTQTVKNSYYSNSNISIVARNHESRLTSIKPLLISVSQLSHVRQEQDKIIILPLSAKDANALVFSLRKNLDPRDFKVEYDSENTSQVLNMLQSLSINLFILVILVALVSSLIIAGGAELSFIESKEDLHRFQLLALNSKQIICILLIQLLTPVLLGITLGLCVTNLFLNDFSSLFFNTVNQIPNLNAPTALSLSYTDYLLAFLYGLTISALAIVFITARVLKIHFASPKLKFSSKIFFGFCVLFGILPFCWTISQKLLINLLILNLFLVSLLPTACLTKAIYFKASQSSFKSLKLAAAYLFNNRRWSLIPSMALISAAIVVISLGVLLTSFESSFSSWLSRNLDKDVFIRRAPLADSSNSSMIDEKDLLTLFQTPELVSPDFLSSSLERIENSNVLVSGTSDSFSNLIQRYNLAIDPNIISAEKLFNMGNAVIVNEIFSNRFKYKISDSFTLLNQPRTILAIYKDYGSQLPTVLIPFSILEREFGISGIANISFNLNANIATEDIINKLKQNLSPENQIFSKSSLIAEALKVFYKTFKITSVIRYMLIGLIFCATLMFVAHCILQEKRSLRVIQIIGASPLFFCSYCCWIGLLLCLPSVFIALPAGIYLGFILVKILNPAHFGWSLELHLNSLDFALYILFIFFAVLVAALLSFYLTYKKIRSTTLSYD